MLNLAAHFQTLTTTDTGNSMWIILLVYAVFIGALYLIFFRPQQKKKKKADEKDKKKEE